MIIFCLFELIYWFWKKVYWYGIKSDCIFRRKKIDMLFFVIFYVIFMLGRVMVGGGVGLLFIVFN